LATANLVIGALVLSLVGATVAVTVRHLTSQNWNFHIQDIWYYIFSGAISISLVVLGMDTATILAATTGINTPIAVLKSSMDKYSERKNKALLNGVSARLDRLEGAKSG
jgi:hypothetical protein